MKKEVTNMKTPKSFICLILAAAVLCSFSGSSADGCWYGTTASLLMRLSTRSGPGTEFDEPGTFFSGDWQYQTVQVMGKHHDGNIWWVQIDFTYGNKSYRVWTGLKRVNVDIRYIPEINSIGHGTVSATETRRGPGYYYAAGPRITHWQDVIAYGWENGFVEVEYRDYDQNRTYRVWVPESTVSIDALIPGSDGEYFNLIN